MRERKQTTSNYKKNTKPKGGSDGYSMLKKEPKGSLHITKEDVGCSWSERAVKIKGCKETKSHSRKIV